MHFDHNCLSALSRLYASENGLPFDALAIDDEHFLMLLDAGVIEEPDGLVFDAWGGKQFAHAGAVRLTVLGRALWEQKAEAEAEQRRKDRESQDSELLRRKERAEDKEDAERRYRGQNRVTIFAALLGSAVGFVLGVMAEHSAQLVALLSLLLR